MSHPPALRNKPVAVTFHSGSHYTALRLLEGFIKREEINLVHLGSPQERFEAMMRGEVEGAALMEPYITLAEKMGCKLVAEGHYTGSDIASDDLDPEVYTSLTKAIKRAVDMINADKRKYVHYMIDDLPEHYRNMITPADFHLPRLRYIDPEPYSAEEFWATAEWMISWGLIKTDADYERLVDNRIKATVEN